MTPSALLVSKSLTQNKGSSFLAYNISQLWAKVIKTTVLNNHKKTALTILALTINPGFRAQPKLFLLWLNSWAPQHKSDYFLTVVRSWLWKMSKRSQTRIRINNLNSDSSHKSLKFLWLSGLLYYVLCDITHEKWPETTEYAKCCRPLCCYRLYDRNVEPLASSSLPSTI